MTLQQFVAPCVRKLASQMQMRTVVVKAMLNSKMPDEVRLSANWIQKLVQPQRRNACDDVSSERMVSGVKPPGSVCSCFWPNMPCPKLALACGAVLTCRHLSEWICWRVHPGLLCSRMLPQPMDVTK